jgi:hypothetical protein
MKHSPQAVLFTNYLENSEWSEINEYVHGNCGDFYYLGGGDTPVRFKKVKHSTKPDVEYERCFILDNETYSAIKSGLAEEPYPDSLGNEVDWKVPMQQPQDEKIKSLILKTLHKSQQVILDMFGHKTVWEFGPFISKMKEGQSLRLHCDGAQYSLPGYPMTDYSAIYYINDDYEGGENVMPALGLRYKPQANSMLLVSNSWHEDSVHSIEKITKGNRYMSQGFFTIDSSQESS